MIWLLLSLGLVTLTVFYIKKECEKPPNFPPGLPKLPLLGSLPFLALINRNRDTLPALARALGPVTSFFIRDQPVILLSDAKVIRETLKQDSLAYRIGMIPFNELNFGGEDGEARGVLISNGEEWKEQRRFALRHLRDFGFGKASMEEIIVQEVEKLINYLKKDVGQPMALHNKMNLSIINALWMVLTGECFALEDERLHSIVQTVDNALRTPSAGVLGFSLVGLTGNAWLMRHYHPTFLHFRKAFDEIHAIVARALGEHKKDIDEANPRDFMDVYIKEINATKDPSSSFYGDMGRKSLLAVYADLFLAGMETTSSSLLWTFLYLLKWPEMKRRVQEELDRVVGSHRFVSLADQSQLPFTHAVIVESMRLTSLVPVTRVATTQDTIIGGYNIPKGTVVLSNLLHVHRDATYWRDPDQFRPERFLSEDGKSVVQDDHLLPFSVGKRFCLGQTLAEKEYFLFFANFMAKFEIMPEPNETLPSIDPLDDTTRGDVRNCPPFRMIIKERA